MNNRLHWTQRSFKTSFNQLFLILSCARAAYVECSFKINLEIPWVHLDRWIQRFQVCYFKYQIIIQCKHNWIIRVQSDSPCFTIAHINGECQTCSWTIRRNKLMLKFSWMHVQFPLSLKFFAPRCDLSFKIQINNLYQTSPICQLKLLNKIVASSRL